MDSCYDDETFFIDSDESRIAGLDLHVSLERIADHRQAVTACELSRLAADEYLEDVLVHLRIMEVIIFGPGPFSSNSWLTLARMKLFQMPP